MPLDVAHWLQAVSDDEPSGPNLEFSLEFGELERAAQGKPEQQLGDSVKAAEDPDWREVEAQALALLDRSRDLRVLWQLSLARLHLGGIEGFADVLGLIRQLLDTAWDSLHPQLDPEDDNDPTLRANVLEQFAKSPRVMRTIRDLPLAEAPKKKLRLAWRDVAILRNELPPEPGRETFTEGQVRGVFAETDPARLASLRAAFAAAAAHVKAIPTTFEAHAGAGTGPTLDKLAELLRDVQRDLDRFAVVEDAAGPEAAEAPSAAGDAAGAAPIAPTRGGASAATLGPISTRADAVRLLDLVMQYYERYEPSSPLPLLIDRARRLADKTFLDILSDMAPDGLRQAQTVAGTVPEFPGA